MIQDKSVLIVAMCVIAGLEGINMLVLKQNGVLLTGAIAAVSSLAAGFYGFRMAKKGEPVEPPKDSI